MRNHRYERMLPSEFIAEVERMPVFIIPTGLLEWHGDHLPLGQDSLKAYGICLRLADKLDGGIVLPYQYIGRPGYSSYPGTMTFSEALMHLLFTELFDELCKMGAKVILLLTGHYGPIQVDCIKKIALNYMEGHRNVTIIARPEYEGVTIDGQSPRDHASQWETSMFWHMYPELTRIDEYTQDSTPKVRYTNSSQDYQREPDIWDWKMNVVENSSREKGQRTVDAIVEHLADLILENLKIWPERYLPEET